VHTAKIVSLVASKGHALAFSVKSGLPGSPVGSGCAGTSIFVPQPRYYFAYCLSSGDPAPPLSTQYIPMPSPVDPVTLPVTFPFENGAIKLVTVVDPVSGCHTVVCDLCINPSHLRASLWILWPGWLLNSSSRKKNG
jgi:hypothetical protein